MTRRRIVAMGGGGFQMEPDNPLLDDHVLALARERSGRDRPRLLLIPTAVADDPGIIADFERLFADKAEPRVLRLLSRLDEPQRRWYAAVEANRRGRGGVRLVAQITDLDEQTIRRGQREVASSLADVPVKRGRRPGGGRPRVEKKIPRS